jgi:RHS repeat-associated protein
MKLLSMVWLLCTAVVLSSSRAQANLAEDVPDVVFSSAIQAKALELGRDPVRIYEFVRNELAFQNYYGLMKGPDATLLSAAGNDYDLSALLVSLLRFSGFPARFVRGKISVPWEDVVAWTGMDDDLAAVWYLGAMQPDLWFENDFLDVTSFSTDEVVDVIHVWVEAFVPMGRYRGSGAKASAVGEVWIGLDPSMKLSDWPSDPGLPMGLVPELTFDYNGPNGLYRKVTGVEPLEIFEDQIQRYLAENADTPGIPHSIKEIALRGTIRKQSPGVLPNSLPYLLSPSLEPRRSDTLVALHEAAAGWPVEAGTDGAAEYRYRRSVHVCLDQTPNCETASSASRLVSASAWSTDWESHRVTLAFPPAASSVGNLSDLGYAQCAGVNGDPIVTTPTLYLDGVPLTPAGGASVNLCDAVTVVIVDTYPSTMSKFSRSRSQHEVLAGGTYVASFDAFATTSASQLEAAEDLLAAQAAFPILEWPGPDGLDRPYIDDDGDGAKGAGERFLSVHFEAQEALIGSLLYLAHTHYWSKTRKAVSQIVALHQQAQLLLPQTALLSAGLSVDYLFDLPYEIAPSRMLMDIQSGEYGVVERSTGFGSDTPLDHSLRLTAHQNSAGEHVIWEEVAGVEGISTVRGFQVSSEFLERTILELKTSAEALVATSSCANNGCTAIGPRTYCEIKKHFGSAGTWRAQAWDTACPDIHDGTTVTLAIADVSEIQDYHGWSGYVYFSEIVHPDRISQFSAIVPLDGTPAGGGFSLDFSFRDMARAAIKFVRDRIPEFLRFDREVVRNLPPENTRATAGDPVEVIAGDYFEVHRDIHILGPGGMSLQLIRAYHSRNDRAGLLGFGWSTTFDQHLRLEAGDPDEIGDEHVVWVSATGSEELWEDTPDALVARASNRHALARNPDGSFRLTLKGGAIYNFSAPDAGARALIESIEDRNGNTISFQYDDDNVDDDTGPVLIAVIDAAGRELALSYDAHGYLASIRDWTGRVWRYTVDGAGNLIAYMDPVQSEIEAASPGFGKPWTYSYYADAQNPTLDHNLKCWIRPEDQRPLGNAAALCGAEAQGHSWIHFSYYADDRVYQQTDANGFTTRFAYNLFAKRTTVTHPDGSAETYHYDRYGNVTRFRSPGGVVRHYAFDGPRREMLVSRDGLGFETTAAYDEAGNLIQQTDRLGNSESWTFNAHGERSSWVDRRGVERRWDYDIRGNLIREEIFNLGNWQTLREYEYDDFGNRVHSTVHRDPAGLEPATEMFFEYRADGIGPVRVIDSDGNSTRIGLDDLGRPIWREKQRTVHHGGSSAPQTLVALAVYDALDREVRSTDPIGLSLERLFDADGQLAEQRRVIPKPGSASPAPRVDVVNSFDAMGRLVESANVLGDSTSFAYDARDRLVSVTSPSGREWNRAYDGGRNLVETIDPVGGVSRFDHDPEGRLVRTIDLLGRISSVEYDPEGRVTRIVGPGNRELRTTAYDPVGQATLVTNAAGDSYEFQYSALGENIMTRGPLMQPEETTSRFSYDLVGRLITRVTDAEGLARTQILKYDQLGRMIEATDGLGRSSHFAYDEVGNLISSLDAAGDHLLYEYDRRGLLLRRFSPDDLSVDDRYAYDGAGLQVLSRNRTTALTFEYDRLGRPIRITDSEGGTAQYSYDIDGDITQVVYPGNELKGLPDGVVAHRKYDPRGKLSTIVDRDAGTWHFEYDAAGRAVRRIEPSGLEQVLSYTPEGFLDKVEIRGAAGGPETIQYRDHDPLGQPRFIDLQSGAGAPVDTTEVTYNRLMQVVAVTYPNAEGSETMNYDAVGNRISHLDRSGTERIFEFDAADQLTSIKDSGGALVESLEYDGAGRLILRRDENGTVAEEYDHNALGQLTGFARSSDGYGMTLAYDAAGNRRTQTDASGTSEYILNLSEVRGGESVRLVVGRGRDEILAEVAAESAATVVRSLFRDGGFNVTHVAEDASLVQTRQYEAFGAVRSTVGASPVERGFAGLPTEGNSGLVNMRARHYDPANGRFVEADPLKIFATHPYAYANNNPYLFVDPNGLDPVKFGDRSEIEVIVIIGTRRDGFQFGAPRLRLDRREFQPRVDRQRYTRSGPSSLSDLFGPEPGNFIKFEVLGFDFVTPIGGFEVGTGFFLGRNIEGELQAGTFVEGGPAVGFGLSVDTLGLEFVGNVEQLSRSLSVKLVVGTGPINVHGNLNPTPLNRAGGTRFFGEFLNGAGVGLSIGPLPVEGFVSFTQTRTFDAIGFGRRMLEP